MDKLINKEKSKYIKGIAIIFMILLHFFAMPKAQGRYNSLLVIFDKNIEYYIGNIGGICVCIFLFLSGYAMYKRFNESISRSDIIVKIKGLYINYLIVFLYLYRLHLLQVDISLIL